MTFTTPITWSASHENVFDAQDANQVNASSQHPHLYHASYRSQQDLIGQTGTNMIGISLPAAPFTYHPQAQNTQHTAAATDHYLRRHDYQYPHTVDDHLQGVELNDNVNSGLSPIMPSDVIDSAASNMQLPKLQFTQPQQALQAFANRDVAHEWLPPTDDSTFPQSQQAREWYVKQMRDAFLDVSQFHDLTQHRHIGRRWEHIAAGYSPETLRNIEIVCWNLLEMTEALHTQGPVTLDIIDSGKLKKVHTSRKSLFAERITDMCDVMRISKTRCDILLSMDDLQMFVGAPKQMGNLSKRMKHNNARRQRQLEAGREILRNVNVEQTQDLLSDPTQH